MMGAHNSLAGDMLKLGVFKGDKCLFNNEEAESMEQFLCECLAKRGIRHHIFGPNTLQVQRLTSYSVEANPRYSVSRVR